MFSAKPRRIIIIDDDPAINLLLKTALVKLGHHVLAFSEPTACQALVKASCGCPQEFPCADVVISDIVMPSMTGIDFFRQQRDRGCKTLPANKALVSATTEPEHIEAVEALGCKFFAKPFKIVEIIHWVEECVERIPEGRVLAKLG